MADGGAAPSCSVAFDAGATVDLVAHPSQDFEWSDGCTALSGADCVVTMDGDRRVTVVFVPYY
jgi:hypothetical protein